MSRRSACCRFSIWSLGSLLLAAVGPALAQPAGGSDFAITSGLAAQQVFQRDAQDQATITVKGTSPVDGVVEASWVSDGQAGKGPRKSDWKKIGEARGGNWSGRVEALPTGGEYTINLRVKDSSGKVAGELSVSHVLVGDLWVLAGQSNMDGVGVLEDVETPSPLVHSYESRETWAVAQEPLLWLLESPDPVHWMGVKPEDRQKKIEEGRRTRTRGAGLGLPFAKEMVRRTGVPVGLVPCSHGGTSMQQWDPALKDEGGKSLYGSMMRRVTAVGGKVKGVLWYQGESDSTADRAAVYPEKLAGLVAAIRKDMNASDLPFYMVQISRVVHDAPWESWNQIQEAQRRAELSLPRVYTVSAIDLELDDLIHIGTQGLKRLGRRLARVALHDSFGMKELTTGPRLVEVKREGPGKGTSIRLRYDNVYERLSPERHIAGFTLTDANGNELQAIYDARVDPKAPNCVLLLLNREIPEGARLYYGHGKNPYCNLVDAADMAAAVFGPIYLDNPATSVAP